MASDYRSIREKNERGYGTEIDRTGKMLLANRYADRTHFIYELLQNTEDALAKRKVCPGKPTRSIRFHLSQHELRVRHFGEPFDEPDVRGICGIAESTKDITQIGRFGIGFKSVYAFTDRPEIHSGAEDFAIESFVRPVALPAVQRDTDETVIVVPLKQSTDCGEIGAGLQRIGPGALLFLREIEEIEWDVVSGSSGLYRRQSKVIDDQARRVTVIGQAKDQPEAEQTWLVFSKAMKTSDNKLVGHVEVAFFLKRNKVLPVRRSPLVVFFPTVVETNLGFCVQGPYRTTLSRDNVPQRDQWNQKCVRETARVLIDALNWLRDRDMLKVDTLRCLPLDRTKFDEDSMFAPLYAETKRALNSRRLLPSFDGGYVAASNAKLARTRELRELFDSEQLTALMGNRQEAVWLTNDISQDRTPELREYLMEELEIVEVTPRMILSKFDAAFLEGQTDEWVSRLYEFLNGQPALRWQVSRLPIIRLEGGAHVPAHADDHQSQPFLPGAAKTDFPTVRAAVCKSESAREFLRGLGLTEPDPVDDVIRNIKPKYSDGTREISDAEYNTDIQRILDAFNTDSNDQREKLVEALRGIPFVKALDAGNASRCRDRPVHLYLATERLRKLFAGITSIRLVDDTCAVLCGEDARSLLEACGAVRHLRPIEDDSISRNHEKLLELREKAGHAETSGRNDSVTDQTLLGLKELLASFSELALDERRTKAQLLWEELTHLEDRRGKNIFAGRYTWTDYGKYAAEFDSAFVRRLNEGEWVPDDEGNLQRPALIPFESLQWTPNPLLLSKIRFKPRDIDQLAKKVGIEPGVLDLLKKLSVTRVADLCKRLGIKEEQTPHNGANSGDVENALKSLCGDTPPPTHDVPDPAGADPAAAASGERSGKGSRGGRQFISYVGTHPDGEESDPDGLDQAARMALEARAIKFILSVEPGWQRAPTHNPGFDLYKNGPDEQPIRWCEVKAMTGSLTDGPVGLSRTQFDCARAHGGAYWLYVVEWAGMDSARIVRIQDPAGNARTFTFDHGWLNIAELDSEEEHRED